MEKTYLISVVVNYCSSLKNRQQLTIVVPSGS